MESPQNFPAPPPAAAAPRVRTWLRPAVGAAITVVWLAVMFSLVRDRILPQQREQRLAAQSMDPANLAADWKDFEEYMLLMYSGKRAGAALTRVRRATGPLGGFEAETRFDMTLNILGVDRSIHIAALARLNAGFQLEEFTMAGDVAGTTVRLNGYVHNEELLLSARYGEETRRMRFSLPTAPSLLEAVRPALARELKLEPGAAISVPVVDPLWSTEAGYVEAVVRGLETVNLDGQTTEAFLVESKFQGIVTRQWVSRDGETLRRQLLGPLFMRRTTREHAEAAGNLMKLELRIPPFDEREFADAVESPAGHVPDRRINPFAMLSGLTGAMGDSEWMPR